MAMLKVLVLLVMVAVCVCDATAQCSSTGSMCKSSCVGEVNGDYQSCHGCHVYVTCSNGIMYDDRPCASGGLSWDDNKKYCDWESDTCGGCITTSADVDVAITCDNRLLFWADGAPKVTSSTAGANDWTAVSTVTVPGDTKVYAVKCVDFGVIAGILASFSNGKVTDNTWKCTSSNQTTNGWMLDNYDDSSWGQAHVITTNSIQASTWGIRAGIVTNANWIWTANWAGPIDTPVYCRLVL